MEYFLQAFAMTDSEELAKKEIEGETYLDKIIFAKYDNYTKTAKLFYKH